MSINIKTVNVGDGDCHIITLINNGLCKIVMIDGGDEGHESDVLQVLKDTLEAQGKQAPDLLVCTHYDSDHIAGLLKVVEKYKGAIGECWMHTPGTPYGKMLEVLKLAVNDKSLGRATNQFTTALVANMESDQAYEKYIRFLIASYDQMKALKAALDGHGVTIREPFADNHISLEGFNEFRVVGPTRHYYQKFSRSNTQPHLLAEPDLLKKGLLSQEEIAEELALLENTTQNVCEKLGKKSGSKVSAVNMVSVIIAYQEGSKKYLFAGDGGIESIEHVPEYQTLLKDLHFMIVPHHGAQYNISSSLIGLFNPKFAFVSAAGKLEGDTVKRPHPYVMGCFSEKGHEVFSTQDCGHYLEFTADSKVIVH